MIQIDHLSKSYYRGKLDIPALWDVSFKIREGEVFSVIGRSGSGKSTLLNMIGGILGLGVGYLVTRVANLILNAKIRPMELERVDMFYFPGWLLIGSMAFAILMSLAAGLYPAALAARIDPVKALRHD